VKEHGIAMGAVRENEATAKALQEKIREQAEKDRLAVQQGTGEDTYEFGPKGFTGRWRMGPEQAQVRIVLFGAYTCKFCKQMEEIAAEQVKLHAGKVNLSFKHFPMNADCNPRMKKAENTAEHRNACWASRCAEACAVFAGANAALKGDESWPASNEAFWKAHDWLYDILGDFNDVSLMDGLTKLGFDAKKITELMETEAANKPVVRDVEEGHALGLFQTPMIFINGIEFKGWQVPGALPAIIATTLAANPPGETSPTWAARRPSATGDRRASCRFPPTQWSARWARPMRRCRYSSSVTRRRRTPARPTRSSGRGWPRRRGRCGTSIVTSPATRPATPSCSRRSSNLGA